MNSTRTPRSGFKRRDVELDDATSAILPANPIEKPQVEDKTALLLFGAAWATDRRRAAALHRVDRSIARSASAIALRPSDMEPQSVEPDAEQAALRRRRVKERGESEDLVRFVFEQFRPGDADAGIDEGRDMARFAGLEPAVVASS